MADGHFCSPYVSVERPHRHPISPEIQKHEAVVGQNLFMSRTVYTLLLLLNPVGPLSIVCMTLSGWPQCPVSKSTQKIGFRVSTETIAINYSSVACYTLCVCVCVPSSQYCEISARGNFKKSPSPLRA